MRHAITSRMIDPPRPSHDFRSTSHAMRDVTPNAPIAPYTASANAAPRPVAGILVDRAAGRRWRDVDQRAAQALRPPVMAGSLAWAGAWSASKAAAIAAMHTTG